mmetsp:Transcript_19455/g.51472  ORF Transcript_19455/g.51472 Transcript_19455/m.51472 type:complete len:243 (-) Transcript_19455:254-982(-)
MAPSLVLRGAPRDLKPRAYQCAELEPVPRISLVFPLGMFTMTQLWSVEAPSRPARHTVQSALALGCAPPTPRSVSAPCEHVTTRIVDRGALGGKSLFTASLLSSLCWRIHLPPCMTFLSTWMPMPPSSRTSLATSVTGWSMTGVTGTPFAMQAWMKVHLSSKSKSLLFVASAVIVVSRQLWRQSWNQSVGASSDRRKQSAALFSRPFALRQTDPTKLAIGMTIMIAKTAAMREEAKIARGTP